MIITKTWQTQTKRRVLDINEGQFKCLSQLKKPYLHTPYYSPSGLLMHGHVNAHPFHLINIDLQTEPCQLNLHRYMWCIHFNCCTASSTEVFASFKSCFLTSTSCMSDCESDAASWAWSSCCLFTKLVDSTTSSSLFLDSACSHPNHHLT